MSFKVLLLNNLFLYYYFSYQMEALPAKDSTSGLSYTYKLRPGVTNIDDYGLTLAREVKMPENLIDHAIEIEKCLLQTKIVSNYVKFDNMLI